MSWKTREDVPKNRFVVALHARAPLRVPLLRDMIVDVRLCKHPDPRFGPREVCYGEYAFRQTDVWDVIRDLEMKIRDYHLFVQHPILDVERCEIPVLIIQNTEI